MFFALRHHSESASITSDVADNATESDFHGNLIV